MAVALTLTCSLSSPILPVSTGPRLVYLLVEIAGGEGAETVPGNLAFVIDASESMRIRLVSEEKFAQLVKSGQVQEIITDGVPAYLIKAIPSELLADLPRRIDYVADALNVASEYLRPADFFSLVAFAGWAHCLIPSMSGSERLRLRLAAPDLEQLRLGNETQMAEGMAMGLEEIKRRLNSSHAARMILLTDGHTLKVSECYEWAEQARQSGVKLTTMGVGTEFNEDLLIPLADLTGGSAYYIETAEQIPDAFHKELGAVQRITYRNLEFKLQLGNEVELRRVYRVLPELGLFDPGPNMEGSYAMQLGDYDPGAPVTLLLELILPYWSAGIYRLGQALLTWEDPTIELERQNLRQDIAIEMIQDAAESLDERVMNVVEKVGAFKMGTFALDHAQSAALTGDFQDKEAATMRLRQAATRLLDLGEIALASSMRKQADTMETSGSLDVEVTKKLRYDTRKISKAQLTNFE
jgi:Ca-activated chloride channel family protein